MISQSVKSARRSSLLLPLSLLALVLSLFSFGSCAKAGVDSVGIVDFFQRQFQGTFSRRAREGLGIEEPFNWQREFTDGPRRRDQKADFFPIFAGDPLNFGALDAGDTFTIAISLVGGMWFMTFRVLKLENASELAFGWGEDSQIGYLTSGDNDSGIADNTIWVGAVSSGATFVAPPDYSPFGRFIPPGETLKVKNEAFSGQTRAHVQIALATRGQLRSPG